MVLIVQAAANSLNSAGGFTTAFLNRFRAKTVPGMVARQRLISRAEAPRQVEYSIR